MERPLGLAFAVIALLAGSSGTAVAGEPVDPNLDDTVLGRAGGVRYASDSVPFDLGSGYADARAGCGGPRWHLVGGGAASGGSPSQAWLAADRPDDSDDPDTRPDDGFLAGGHGAGGAAITAYSVCVRGADLVYRFQPIENQPSGLRSGTAACGATRWHVTSGSPFISTSNSWLASSVPVDRGDADSTRDDGWGGTALDTVGGGGGFYLFAVCARSLDLRYAHGTRVSITQGAAGHAKAGCGRRGHVVGGGADVEGPANRIRLVSSSPFDGPDADSVPDDGWKVQAYNLSGLPKRVRPFAICLR